VRVLSNVMPGLREVRAPLAAGYLWLACFWLVFGDEVPTRSAVEGPLERLYELEPAVSDVGLAVVVSVAAYIIGSIVVDAQVLFGRTLHNLFVLRKPGHLLKTDQVAAKTEKSITSRPTEKRLRELPLTGAGRQDLATLVEQVRREAVKPPAQQSAGEAADQQPAQHSVGEAADQRAQQSAAEAADQQPARQSAEPAQPLWAAKDRLDYRNAHARDWISRNRAVLKTRLLDASQALHSEVDRPDAEATFRMALWPPLASIVAYLTAMVASLWAVALVVPGMLALQWISLRRQANDALVTGMATRDDVRRLFHEGVVRQWEQGASSNLDVQGDSRRAFECPTPHVKAHAHSARDSTPTARGPV
jgi:hypothetical protein